MELARNDLETRIARLEKSARRWRFAALAGMVVITSGVLMGQAIRIGGAGISAPTITVDKATVKNLVLVGAENAERASISVDATDNVIFAVKDKAGVNTIELRSDADGVADLRVLTNKGKTLATLSNDGKDQGAFVLKDKDGKKLFAAP